MEFWASSESYAPADANLERARKCVEVCLKSAISKSSMANYDLTIRYVPIVMPKNMLDKYKERSRARINQRIYDCSPQLDYDLFVSGSFDDQISEYIRGIALSGPHLKKFGLGKSQIEEFNNIITTVLGLILEHCRDKTRH